MAVAPRASEIRSELTRGSLGLARIHVSVLLHLVTIGCSDPNPSEERIVEVVPVASSTDFALSFDGEDDYATMGTARFAMPTMAQTISMWVAPGTTAKDAALITLRRDDSGNEFGLTAARVPLVTRIWASSELVASPFPLAAGRWQHLAYVHDLASHSLYVDGVLQISASGTPDNRSPTTGWLGTYDGVERCFHGLIDELRIWTLARTQEEIAAEMAGEAPTTDPDLVGYYSFDEFDGPRVYDRSGNGNHMTLGDGLPGASPHRVPTTRPGH